MNSKSLFFLGFIFLIILQSCKLDPQNEHFDIEGISTLAIKNESGKTRKIKIENWYQIPWKAQVIDTVITKGASIDLKMITQGNNYYKIEMGEEKFKVFASPNSSTHITLSPNKQIQYSGTLKSINKFLYKKSKDFESIDAESMPRTNLTHGNGTTKYLLEGNDSITQIHLDYLHANQEHLPDWFITFEKKRLKCLTIDWQLRSVWYRRALLSRTDSLPDDFLTKSLEHLAITDQSLFGNENYLLFLNSYILLKSNFFYHTKRPISKEDYQEIYRRNFKTIQQEIKRPLKDVLLTYELAKIMESQRHTFEENWIDMVEDEKLSTYLKQLYLSNPILPAGAKLPFFSLLDVHNTRHESREFKGQILLINFWATWCKPCIEEFPYEDDLVTQFKEERVKIINICIESDSIKWKSMVEKGKLTTLNLIANNNWEEKLTKDFGIQSLPHSTLVDWNGKIVQNKCPRASQGIDELIKQLLIDRQNN